MKISEDLLKEHYVMLPEAYKIFHPHIINVEEDVYNTFLSNTNNIPALIFEEFIEDMAAADNIADFTKVMLSFFKKVKVEYDDVLEARKIARTELENIRKQYTANTEKESEVSHNENI